MANKIAIIIDTSYSMTDDPGRGITWQHQPPHRGDFLKDWPMGVLAIDIGKRIADDSGSPFTRSSPTTVDIFGFGSGIHSNPIPQQYKSFDEISAPNGGTPMTDCLEFLIKTQDYDNIYAISDGISVRPATGPWPDSVVTILVIPRIEDTHIFQEILEYDPHTAATIIAAFIL